VADFPNNLKPNLTAMKDFKKILAISAVTVLTSCASIVSKSNWPFSVDSNPEGAKVIITNKKGKEVFVGKTPTALKLKSGAGFFSKESYTVELIMNGYESKKVNIECKVNGWYFGNFIIGGLIGLLIVDPATGAMYKLDSKGITENLYRSTSTGATLKILDKNSIPENWKEHLVRVD
jgi:hypothetical protein